MMGVGNGAYPLPPEDLPDDFHRGGEDFLAEEKDHDLPQLSRRPAVVFFILMIEMQARHAGHLVSLDSFPFV
jgi:hypothetical protein